MSARFTRSPVSFSASSAIRYSASTWYFPSSRSIWRIAGPLASTRSPAAPLSLRVIIAVLYSFVFFLRSSPIFSLLCYSYIVFLFSEDSVSDIKNISMLKEFLKQNFLKVGISSPFEDEADTQNYYELAKAALQLGQRLDGDVNIYLYDEYKIVDIINEISGSRSLYSLCFRPMIKLIEADAEEENMLVDTLFTYISNQFSIKKTCEQLFIHRNTLYYRFEKIRSIMGCDFMEYPNLIDIGITMMILKYLNLSPVNLTYDGKKG